MAQCENKNVCSNESKWIKLLRSLYGILFDPISLSIFLNDCKEGGSCMIMKVAVLLRSENKWS